MILVVFIADGTSEHPLEHVLGDAQLSGHEAFQLPADALVAMTHLCTYSHVSWEGTIEEQMIVFLSLEVEFVLQQSGDVCTSKRHILLIY